MGAQSKRTDEAVKPGIKIQNVINSQRPGKKIGRNRSCKARHKNTKCNQFTTSGVFDDLKTAL